MAMAFSKLFPTKRPAVIGMIHVLPLPGTPLHGGNVQKIVDKACQETEIYLKNNIDSILVENMHDIPYVQSKHFGPETTAFMTRVCTEIRKLVPKTFPLGIQVLATGNKEALAIAHATDFNYIRAEGFVFSHVADEGFTDANAGIILRYRKKIGADNIMVLTDIKKKHSSHAITSDISLVETAKAAEFFLSDGIILTGTATGDPANIGELRDLKTNTNLPIIIGSGITISNFSDYYSASGFIIGSHFKEGGDWRKDVSVKRVNQFMSLFQNHNN